MPINNLPSDLWFASTLHLRSAALILRRPRMIFWASLPAALTLALYFWLLGGIRSFVENWILRIVSGPSTPVWISSISGFLLSVLIVLIGVLTFSYVATLLASPLNDFLAEATERYTDLPPLPPSRFVEKLRLLSIDAAKTVASMVFSLFLILCAWIPAVGVASAAMLALLVTFQYVSYPQTRRGIGLLEGLKWIFKRPLPCAAFGFVTLFLFSIPFFAWIALPLSVVGGTLLYSRLR